MALDTTYRNLRKIITASVSNYGAEIAEVVEVDITQFVLTCVGQKTGRAYEEIPFVTVPGEMDSIIKIPDIGAMVLVLQLDDQNFYCIDQGKLTQILLNAPSIVNNITDEFIVTDTDNVEFKLLPEGMYLKVSDQSLKDALDEFLSAIEQLTVNTPNGPSSVPINISALTAAKNKILSCFQ